MKVQGRQVKCSRFSNERTLLELSEFDCDRNDTISKVRRKVVFILLIIIGSTLALDFGSKRLTVRVILT